MIKENVKIDTGNIVTYRRSKKTNDILYFSHANGFCGQVYTDLLNKIDNSYEVITYDMRGHGETDLIADSNKLKSWYTFRDDLEQLVEKHSEPVTLLSLIHISEPTRQEAIS